MRYKAHSVPMAPVKGQRARGKGAAGRQGLLGGSARRGRPQRAAGMYGHGGGGKVPELLGGSGGDGRGLKDRIAGFYDDSSQLWERVWGEHMHHGIYPGGFDREDHVRAQVEMIDRVVDSAGVERAESVLDAGCGVGGALRHIATRFDAAGAGITLSQYQARRATELSEEGGFEALDFLVADACDQPFGDSTFDFVLSLEVGEHIPDRAAFLRELARVAAPGAKIAVVAWTRRELGSSETSLPPDEQAILDALSGAFNLPRWSPASEYVRLMERECGLEGVRSQDWTKEVEPFWRAVVASALTPDGIGGLLRAGPPSWLGAAAMPLMQVGFARGTVRFSVLSATKPSSRFPETG